MMMVGYWKETRKKQHELPLKCVFANLLLFSFLHLIFTLLGLWLITFKQVLLLLLLLLLSFVCIPPTYTMISVAIHVKCKMILMSLQAICIQPFIYSFIHSFLFYFSFTILTIITVSIWFVCEMHNNKTALSAKMKDI